MPISRLPAVTTLRSPSLMSVAFPTNHSAISYCSNEKVGQKLPDAAASGNGRAAGPAHGWSLISPQAAAMLHRKPQRHGIFREDGMRLKSLAALALAAGMLCGLNATAFAQDYPNRPVKIIIAFS